MVSLKKSYSLILISSSSWILVSSANNLASLKECGSINNLDHSLYLFSNTCALIFTSSRLVSYWWKYSLQTSFIFLKDCFRCSPIPSVYPLIPLNIPSILSFSIWFWPSNLIVSSSLRVSTASMHVLRTSPSSLFKVTVKSLMF